MQPADDSEAITQATYNRLAQAWTASDEQANPFWQAELARFKELLPGGSVLEIGHGGGRDACELSKFGYKYTGIDNAAAMVKIASERWPQLTFLQKSVYNLDFAPGSFDGFWAAAVLLHLPKHRINEALRQIHTVVRPGGIGMITMRQGNFEGLRRKTKHGQADDRYFSYYTLKSFSDILTRNGFEVLETSERPEGDEYLWLTFFVSVR